MIILTKNDIKFLQLQTSLSIDKLNLLIEEESDLNLILDTISNRNFNIKQFKKLSFALLTKIIVFKVSKDKNYDITEKAYISDAIINFLPIIAKNKKITYFKKKTDDYSKYYIVLFGFLENITDKDVFNKIESAYRLAGQRELAQHLRDWVSLIREVKYHFFTTVNS